MRSVLSIICVSLLFNVCSQNEWQTLNDKRVKTSENLMLGLGGWASANIVGGTIGWATAPNDEMIAFHSMNIAWNAVNLGIAVGGYVKARKSDTELSFAETLREQRKVENVFLINAGVDVAYLSTGIILRREAKSNAKYDNLMDGFGNSLMIQGGFLLIFDWMAYAIHKSHRKKELSPLMERIELSDSGLGLKFKLD